MPDDIPPQETAPSRTILVLPALIFGAGLLIIALLHAQSRPVALAFVGAGVVFSLLARGGRGRPPRGRRSEPAALPFGPTQA